MAAEAAFASGEVAKPGDQVSFGRIRVRMDGMTPLATYHVTTPYGELISKPTTAAGSSRPPTSVR